MALLGAALLPASTESAVGATFGPGDYMESTEQACTLNFVFDGTGPRAGKVYVGTAAHCVNRVGEPISTDAFPNIGAVVLIGNADVTAQDYALIEVRSDLHGAVRASVRGYPQYPTGYTVSNETRIGERIQASGYGLGFDLTQPTREKRIGVLTYDNAELFEFAGAMMWGDSGGPLVHVPTGKALGIESRVCLGACTDEGPTVEGILAKAAARGYPLQLRTV